MRWAFIAIVAASFLAGFSVGVRYQEGRQAVATLAAQRVAFDAAETASRHEVARLEAERGRAALASQMEDMARADENASRLCLGADSVLRLNAR